MTMTANDLVTHAKDLDQAMSVMPCEEPGHDLGKDEWGILHYGHGEWYIRVDHDTCCTQQKSANGVEIEAVCSGVVDWIGANGSRTFECEYCGAAVKLEEWVTVLGMVAEFK